MAKYVVYREIDTNQFPEEMPYADQYVIEAQNEIEAVEQYNNKIPEGGGLVAGRISPDCRINVRLGSIDTVTLKQLYQNNYIVPVNY